MSQTSYANTVIINNVHRLIHVSVELLLSAGAVTMKLSVLFVQFKYLYKVLRIQSSSLSSQHFDFGLVLGELLSGQMLTIE